MNFWQYLNDNPWMSFWFSLLLAGAFKYTLRMISITVRGWPPSHLDADGDFKQDK
jgi:hypothetical protein